MSLYLSHAFGHKNSKLTSRLTFSMTLYTYNIFSTVCFRVSEPVEGFIPSKEYRYPYIYTSVLPKLVLFFVYGIR